jgi:hypothetical protein
MGLESQLFIDANGGTVALADVEHNCRNLHAQQVVGHRASDAGSQAASASITAGVDIAECANAYRRCNYMRTGYRDQPIAPVDTIIDPLLEHHGHEEIRCFARRFAVSV